MFNRGQIVKSKLRTETHPLFLMVLADPNPIKEQFNAVVLYDKSYCNDIGEPSNDWNTNKFELSSWNEVKQFI